MRVFVAGATGAIGRPLTRRLVEAGHEVTGATRSPARAAIVEAAGARAVVADAFDAHGLARAVARCRAEAVLHELTDIPPDLDPRRYGEQMAGNDRLRVEGTRNLVEAARAAGATRFLAQSVAFAYRPGPGLAVEDEPLWDDAPEPFRRSVRALRSLEAQTLAAPGMSGLVLRYGLLYGPGTGYAPGGSWIERIRRREFPLVGDGGAVASFLHVEDAAAATVLALERGTTGVLNLVDDDPAPAREWLPCLAELAGAKRPLHVPAFVARIAAGELVVLLATRTRGASNARAKRLLGWSPLHPSWREGMRGELAGK